jgi:hypothetical protein
MLDWIRRAVPCRAVTRRRPRDVRTRVWDVLARPSEAVRLRCAFLGKNGTVLWPGFALRLGRPSELRRIMWARCDVLRTAPCCYFAPGDVLPLTEPAAPLVDVPLTEPVEPVSVLAPPLAVTPPDDSTSFAPAPAAPLLFPLPELGDKAALPDVPVLPDDAEPGAGLVVTAPASDVPASILEPELSVTPDDDPVPFEPPPTAAAVPSAPLSFARTPGSTRKPAPKRMRRLLFS